MMSQYIAYDDTVKQNLFLPALIVSLLPILACLFLASAPTDCLMILADKEALFRQSKYYYGDSHNAVESKVVVLKKKVNEEEIARLAIEAVERARVAAGI